MEAPLVRPPRELPAQIVSSDFGGLFIVIESQCPWLRRSPGRRLRRDARQSPSGAGILRVPPAFIAVVAAALRDAAIKSEGSCVVPLTVFLVRVSPAQASSLGGFILRLPAP